MSTNVGRDAQHAGALPMNRDSFGLAYSLAAHRFLQIADRGTGMLPRAKRREPWGYDLLS